MMNLMIDLETLGTRPGCAILSIGVVEFHEGGLGVEYYSVINRASCEDVGLTEDRSTIAWWDGQQDKSVLLEAGNAESPRIGDALADLKMWFEHLPARKEDIRVWGNGADFDLPILSEAFRRCGMGLPWMPYSGRCYRTLKNLNLDLKIERLGTHHNALDDAKSQAAHAVKLLASIGG